MGDRDRYMGVEEIRGRLGAIAIEIAEGAEPLILTRRGRPLAVLISLRDYEKVRKKRR